ncbi:T-complex protein 1 subunit beta [Coccidioides immitis RMSCC 3703]|uniref:T-complex protein 1 subunit beta n=1 Tax=Coccidioides immitis RMSCC 3703 TaxID=454286 RepID=A0A0J8QJA8_COCIT|nr:T-complex protein 1 subunit beta [Coccidioides immitis RMSCC 3703]
MSSGLDLLTPGGGIANMRELGVVENYKLKRAGVSSASETAEVGIVQAQQINEKEIGNGVAGIVATSAKLKSHIFARHDNEIVNCTPGYPTSLPALCPKRSSPRRDVASGNKNRPSIISFANAPLAVCYWLLCGMVLV